MPVDYPEAFEEVWRETGRHGNKHKAHEKWVKAGRWPWRKLQAPYEAYLRSERPAKLQAVQDLSTWLHQRGHLQDWPAWTPPAPTNGHANGASSVKPWVLAEQAREKARQAEAEAVANAYQKLARGS